MSVAILAPGSRTRRFSKRLTQVVVTLFGLLLLTFVIGRVMPVDPVLAIVGPDADHEPGPVVGGEMMQLAVLANENKPKALNAALPA